MCVCLVGHKTLLVDYVCVWYVVHVCVWYVVYVCVWYVCRVQVVWHVTAQFPVFRYFIWAFVACLKCPCVLLLEVSMHALISLPT